MVGQVLGDRYTLEERIGQGGMSVVWRGTDTVLGRQVAVKILAGASATRLAYHGSIRTDARAAASLSHPNVAAVFDYGEYTTGSGERTPYVVAELLPGRTLAQRLQDGPLEPPLALRVCAQVAGALAAAHAGGLVHRDIKPGNVVLTPGGAKVIDFGIAAAVGQLDGVDPGAPILGTAAYLAPERLAGAPVVAASDVYALGLLVFRALTNELPWPAETVTEMIAANVYANPGPLPDLPGVPAAVRELVDQCLSKEPLDRPSARTAAIVLADAAMIEPPLGEEQLGLAVRHPRPGPAVPRSAGPDRPRVRRAASTGVGHDARVPPSGTDGPRRRFIPTAAIAAAIVIAAVLVPVLLNRTPGASGGEGQPAPGAGSTEPAHGADPEATFRASGTPDPHADGATPPATSPAGASGTNPGVPVGTGPAGTETTTSTVTGGPPTSPPQTFESAGGTMTASCQGTKAVLTSWAAKPTYTVKNVEPGPATVARVTFQSTSERTAVVTRVTCPNGTPVANTSAGG